jgi:hypothetical protein
MATRPDLISEPMDAPQDSTPKPTEGSKVDERVGSGGDTQMATASPPSYRPPGYPDFGSMWSQPPQPLPGPVDHPFFKWVSEGAKRDPNVLATMSPRAHPAQSIVPLRPVSSTLAAPVAIQPHTVYPFVPPPSVAMEPMTPDTKTVRSFIPSPAQTTPDLSSSPTEPSPSSAHTATPASTGKQPLDDSKDDPGAPVPAEQQCEETKSTPERPDDPECTSSYMRLVNNPVDTPAERPPTVVSGQIWRSGSKREGWRRHQWSMDIG